MTVLLNLFAAIALLVWGTHLVRAGVLVVFGARLRQFLHSSLSHRITAVLAGVGVTALVQSSTATSLMTASFVGQGLIALPAALAVMRGADIGTALISVLFTFDLSWLSPLCLLSGVVLSVTYGERSRGHLGRVFIGLGLMLVALRMIVAATGPLFDGPAMRSVIASIHSDVMLEIVLGAFLAVLTYSSLAVVLLVAAMASTAVVPMDVALGLVLGANLGSGVLALLTSAKAPVEARRVTVGNLIFKLLGVTLAIPLVPLWLKHVAPSIADATQVVVLFHLAFNMVSSLALTGLTNPVAKLATRLLPDPAPSPASTRPHHLDPATLSTPSLAISSAAREAMHQADVVENMLTGMMTVMRENDLQLAQQLRQLDDVVDRSYSDIKYFLTRISPAALNEEDRRRWSDIISFAINMEQVADIIERSIADIEDKKIRRHRSFSAAGMAEITELHERLLANLRLSMSVFLTKNVEDARKLIEEKGRFRDLERTYAYTHLSRLTDRTTRSIETSALHLDLISDLKRMNSHICAIAYPLLHPQRQAH